jgi:hypothetical protein
VGARHAALRDAHRPAALLRPAGALGGRE